MKILDKIKMNTRGHDENGPITIVALGDSITHGYLCGEIDYESVYHNRLRKKLNEFNSQIPVNVINAGIGGRTAKQSLSRLDSQVLSHNLDLVIV